jgi:hypothetical protein
MSGWRGGRDHRPTDRPPRAPHPGSQLALDVVFSYHAIFTDRTGPLLEVEADHRHHTIVEHGICDLKHHAGLAHLPSGRLPQRRLAGPGRDRLQPRTLDRAGRRAWAASPPMPLRLTIINTPARLVTSPGDGGCGCPPAGNGPTTSPPPWPSSARSSPPPADAPTVLSDTTPSPPAPGSPPGASACRHSSQTAHQIKKSTQPAGTTNNQTLKCDTEFIPVHPSLVWIGSSRSANPRIRRPFASCASSA